MSTKILENLRQKAAEALGIDWEADIGRLVFTAYDTDADGNQVKIEIPIPSSLGMERLMMIPELDDREEYDSDEAFAMAASRRRHELKAVLDWDAAQMKCDPDSPEWPALPVYDSPEWRIAVQKAGASLRMHLVTPWERAVGAMFAEIQKKNLDKLAAVADEAWEIHGQQLQGSRNGSAEFPSSG